jgi:hypothetical protein
LISSNLPISFFSISLTSTGNRVVYTTLATALGGGGGGSDLLQLRPAHDDDSWRERSKGFLLPGLGMAAALAEAMVQEQLRRWQTQQRGRDGFGRSHPS